MEELGGTHSYNHYPWGWTWAGDTPFRRWKRETYRGGTTDPFILAWPRGMQARNAVRRQYTHAIDMVPTVLEALGLEPPRTIRGVSQSPLQGVSFAASFDAPETPSQHVTQYFEMLGHRAIDHDGWRAVCPWPGPSFSEAAKHGRQFGSPITPAILDELETSGWELYHLAQDPTEATNVAATYPDKLRELIALWWVEAGKYQVLPLDGSLHERLRAERPQTTKPRTHFVYYPHGSVVPPAAAPSVLNRSHRLEADVEIPAGGAQGVLLAQGGVVGGYVLYVMDGRLRYAHNYAGREIFEVASSEPVPQGRHRLRMEFEATGQPDFARGKGAAGRFQLYIDGHLVGTTDVPYTTPVAFGIAEGLSCGYDFGSPVLAGVYAPPFAFTGSLHQVAVDVSGELIKDDEALVRELIAQQ
jgi:arylsulfatase